MSDDHVNIRDDPIVTGVISGFIKEVKEEHNTASGVLAIESLLKIIEQTPSTTMMELQGQLNTTVSKLVDSCPDRMKAVMRGLWVTQEHKLFDKNTKERCKINPIKLIEMIPLRPFFSILTFRFVTRTSLERKDFGTSRDSLIHRGKEYLKLAKNARQKIASAFFGFIRDGSNVLVHSYSRVVIRILRHAASKGMKFHVFLTLFGHPNEFCVRTVNDLRKFKINVSVVDPRAVAYIMNRIDIVLVGAESVEENGGIINKIGTFQIAHLAKSFSKPFYVAVEAYKFSKSFPLSQEDIENNHSIEDDVPIKKVIGDCPLIMPKSDFTPSGLITLFFTDLGIYTPAAVSDELVKLYQ